MASLEDLSWKDRVLLRAYRFRQIVPVPWTAPSKPLAQCRVALVTTAGLVPPDQPDFDLELRGGDFSYRVIDRDVEAARLRECHRSRSFNHADVQADANVAFPLDRLRELAAQGTIGEVAPRHLSFMGSITAPGRLVRESAPEAAELLVHDGVDVASLAPCSARRRAGYSVALTSDDLPAPDTPVIATSTPTGTSASTPLRLCSRAPRSSIQPCGLRRVGGISMRCLPDM
jgi:D-proline reductase (dithiol) PrdB